MGEESRMVERIIERVERPSNGGFSKFKDIVFCAVVLAAGGIIWEQQRDIDALARDIAVLKVECSNQPTKRGPGG